ncbi:hypothetical protein FK178_07225 [Antarcticibacterium arcticum]|uniref:Uncharacterized protein n=1 Tax=Antarcticibacterium arcticum TaxID=2585771 RepID=A0A5B8YL49_9FLAO|nr:hypothetical protein [Antarcticibacterium arcticum]QED37527.1 hypothetical protein FK178_07225 [Antarcticibacterium arcticum]
MKLFLTILLITFCLPVVAQVQNKTNVIKSVYIPLKAYKATGKTLTAQDTLDFRFNKNDTLVKMPEDYDIEAHAKGIRVPYEFKNEEFLKVYKNTVFNDDVKSPRKKPTIKIWRDEIKIYFEPTVPRSHRKELMTMANQLSAEIDSLNITQVRNRGKANYLVYYITDKSNLDLEPRITDPKKGYYIHWNGRQQIERAMLKVDSRLLFNEEDQIENLKSTFFMSLGMFHLTRQVPHNSFLSYSSIGKELTSIDKEILKYHYSYGICKGTTLEAFANTHASYLEMIKENPNSKLYVVHSHDYFK